MNIDEIIDQENEKVNISRAKMRNSVFLSVAICFVLFAATALGVWYFYFEKRIESEADNLRQDYNAKVTEISNQQKDVEPEVIIIKQVEKAADDSKDSDKEDDKSKENANKDDSSNSQNSDQKDPAASKPASYVGHSTRIASSADAYVNSKVTGWQMVQNALVDSGYPKKGATQINGSPEYVLFLELGKKVSTSKNSLQPGDILQFGKLHDPIAADYMGIYKGDGKVVMSKNQKVVEIDFPDDLGLTRVVRMP